MGLVFSHESSPPFYYGKKYTLGFGIMNCKEKVKTETITIRVYPETKEKLKEYAKGSGVFLSSLIEGVLVDWLEKKE